MPELSTDLQVYALPMDKIYCDNDFNCRGKIMPFDVTELATSMRNVGLQFAISVQPASDVDGGLPPGFEYRIIAGHRRYTAAKVLQWATINATIRPKLNEANARILNLIENFQRKDLNILQEANALKHLHEAGVPRESVAKEIGMSSGWVQVRYALLRLPEAIQLEAAAGILNQAQVKQLTSLKTPEAQFEAVRKIKEAKEKGAKAGDIVERKKITTSVKRERKRQELFDMIEIIATSGAGYGLGTRCLAWAAGEISTDDLFAEIKKIDAGFYPPTTF